MSANVFFQYVVQVALTAGKFIPDIGWLFEIGKALVQKHKDIKQDQRLAELESAMQATPQQVREIVQLEIARLKQAGKQVSPALEKEVTERSTVMPALIRQRLNQATRQAKRQGTTLIQALPIGDQASEDSKITFYNQLFPSRSLHFQIGDNVPHRTPVWQLKELLGIGSVGEVWKATSELGDSVAVKFCLDEAAANLLKNEVKTLQELRRQLPKHPQIVQLREIQLEQMPYWLAFEYVEGGTLENLMQTKTFSWQQSVDLIMPLIQAMAKVHEVGIIHRDLKPANILITDENTLKITDFGVSKIFFKSDATQTKTVGFWAFTKTYACIEQQNGEIPHTSDDVYALCVILWQMLSKKLSSPNYVHDSLENLYIPKEIKEILIRCITKPRLKRIQTANYLLQELQGIIKHYYNLPSMFITIDFGNISSGFAYCFSAHTSAGDIYKNTDWNKLVGQKPPYVKTPTHLLYEGTKLDSWGYKAKQRLIELRHKNAVSNYHFFEKFKTLLFEYEKVGLPINEQGEPYLEDDGEKFLLTDLVADYLREMRLIALSDVRNHIGMNIDETQIRWCLTVPAIWNDAAKQLMKKAARKACILKDDDWDAERFIFVLEPEALAEYCLYVADKELGIVEDKSTMMIVDCGEGTVDLTVHKIVREWRNKGLREVTPGSGAADGHGRKDVDKNFLNYLAKVLGGGAIDKFEKDYPEAYVQMMDDWETFKYGFDPADYERGNFRIPSELRDLLQKQYPKVLQELASKQNGNSFYVWLTRKVMEEDIFNPVVNNILTRVEEMFNRISGKCDYLYLGGGFATSRFLQQRIKDKFSSNVKKKIIIPGEPGKSIMIGAASFARNRDLYQFEICRLF